MSDGLIDSNNDINSTFKTGEKYFEEEDLNTETSKNNELPQQDVTIKIKAKKSLEVLSNDISKNKMKDNNADELSKNHRFIVELKQNISLRMIFKYKGILFALLSAIFLSSASYLVKKLRARGYSQYLITFWRFQGVLLPSFPMILYYRFYKKELIFDSLLPFCKGDHNKISILLVIRCLVGTCYYIFQYTALATVDLADMCVISSSSTVFVVLLAWCFLREKCGIVPTIIAFFTVAGVVIIARPPIIFGENKSGASKLEGVLFSLAAMVSSALSVILIRCLRDIHYSVMALVFGVIGSLIGGILAIITDNELMSPKNLEHTIFFVAMAILSCLGQICVTLALKYEEAGPVSVVRSSETCFAFVWQTFDKVYPNWYSGGGGFIVTACVVLTGYRKWLYSLKAEHPWKKKFWFLLK